MRLPPHVLHSFSATLFVMCSGSCQAGILLPIRQTPKHPDMTSLGTLGMVLCLLGFQILSLLFTGCCDDTLFSLFVASWEVRGSNYFPLYMVYNLASGLAVFRPPSMKQILTQPC